MFQYTERSSMTFPIFRFLGASVGAGRLLGARLVGGNILPTGLGGIPASGLGGGISTLGP